MSGNMAFFFDLVALYLVALPGGSTWWPSTWWPSTWWLYLVALYLVALPGGPLPGGSTWWLYLVHQCAVPCTTLHHQLPPLLAIVK